MLSLRDETILTMYQTGLSPQSIALRLGMAPGDVRKKLKSPSFVAEMLDADECTDSLLRTLYRDSAEALREALHSESHTIRLKAAELTFRVLGKLQPKEAASSGDQINVTKILQIIQAPPSEQELKEAHGYCRAAISGAIDCAAETVSSSALDS